ncbi:lipid-binding SYLF domain-containing protein [Aliidongia dinghuensis]|uniref:lipid-binding SYLF domain-containing protein n=1 Tax=Aliidongia dinghuensis TaxID=1867774 RepID=UPI00166605B5|nr:lipid-binding SYLF domain-containing protein [Aliidongia dinghuensis]
MLTVWKRAFGAIAALGLMTATASAAFAASDQQDLVEHARITLDDLHKDKEFGNGAELLRRAKGVLIVPSLIKGGFFLGGEGGTGVLLTRGAGREWSYPAFYTLASASFGLQIGGEEAELIVFALTDKGLQAFMRDEFKIGAQAGLAVVTLGSTAEASTTSALNADLVVWSSSSGAYAGITLNGSIIKPRDSWNEAYYGHAVSPATIVNKRSVKNTGADSLRTTLASQS